MPAGGRSLAAPDRRGRAWRWGLVVAVAWLLIGCTPAAPSPTPPPAAVTSIVGTVTAPLTRTTRGQPYFLITSADGPGAVEVPATTVVQQAVAGQLQPLVPAAIQVGDRVTILVDGVINQSSPTQMTAAEIIVGR